MDNFNKWEYARNQGENDILCLLNTIFFFSLPFLLPIMQLHFLQHTITSHQDKVTGTQKNRDTTIFGSYVNGTDVTIQFCTALSIK